jgi:hypothetical protein
MRRSTGYAAKFNCADYGYTANCSCRLSVAVDASDVSLNSGIFQVAYRNMSGENQSAQQIDIAHQTAQSICVKVAPDLTQQGITTTCLQRGVAPTGNNVLVLDGQFTDINEGNRRQCPNSC